MIFQDPAEGVWALFSLLSSGSTRIGVGLGYNNYRYPVSSPCPQSTLQSALSTLFLCARMVPTIHLILHLFDQSVKCTNWEHIMPPTFVVLGIACPQSSCRAAWFSYWLFTLFFGSLSGHRYLFEPLLSPLINP